MKVPRTAPSYVSMVDVFAAMDVSLSANAFRPLDPRGRYLHWEQMQSRTPPAGLTLAQWWAGTLFARMAMSRQLPLVSTDGHPFRFSNVDSIQEMVHRIDQKASGQLLADDMVTNLRSSDRYLVSSLVEEAITSSQLEGASTTRRVAKELLATGREPRNHSEQMILNNYNAMLFAQELATQDLTPTDVLDLHRIVTEGTLTNPEDAGRLQPPGDVRISVRWDDDRLLHQPPPAEQLPERLAALCHFANEGVSDGFIHPVVEAILIHLWIGYDHPFVDGNGRLARALFYWAMLRRGYWLAQYLSVSSILRKAPGKYAMSYLYTETDSFDATYFVIYQLQVIERSINGLHEYLARKISEIQSIEQMIHGTPNLNNRQLTVIRDALRDPAEPFTIQAQARRNRVTYESARSDLLGLERLGLFSKEKAGKKYVFHSDPDLSEKLRRLGRRNRKGGTRRRQPK